MNQPAVLGVLLKDSSTEYNFFHILNLNFKYSLYYCKKLIKHQNYVILKIVIGCCVYIYWNKRFNVKRKHETF